MTEPEARFPLQAVAYLIQPWRRTARTLDQLRDGIAEAPADVLFHHTVEHRLRGAGAGRAPSDDFSAWIAGVLQDGETAERLSFAVQDQNQSAESLRSSLLSALDRVPGPRRSDHEAAPGSEFLFVAAIPVTYPAGLSPLPDEVIPVLAAGDPSIWFHHLVAEPWFLERRAPILAWLEASRRPRIARWLEESAMGGEPVQAARAQLLRRWKRSRIPARLAAAAGERDVERRDAGREALTRLLRGRRPRNDAP